MLSTGESTDRAEKYQQAETQDKTYYCLAIKPTLILVHDVEFFPKQSTKKHSVSLGTNHGLHAFIKGLLWFNKIKLATKFLFPIHCDLLLSPSKNNFSIMHKQLPFPALSWLSQQNSRHSNINTHTCSVLLPAAFTLKFECLFTGCLVCIKTQEDCDHVQMVTGYSEGVKSISVTGQSKRTLLYLLTTLFVRCW